MTVLLGIRAVAANRVHWTPKRKSAVLLELDEADEAQRADIMAEHGLSIEEVNQWRRAHERLGVGGLRVTKQTVRQTLRRPAGSLDRAPYQNEIEPGRPVVNDWGRHLVESWADRKARLAEERARQ
jgi:hypothetical protein